MKISGADSDFHRRDLWEAIEAGAYPEWELAVQVFSERDAEKYSFDVLDATKIVPEELVPLTPIGRMVLNRNPDNFFAETEQVAFCTAHIVPGIDFSNDPLLAGRIHSYVDTQISRLGGPNFHEIPINAPIAQVHNNQRDGMHRQAIPRGRVAYEPNSLGGGCPFQAGTMGFMSFPQEIEEHKVRGKPEKFAEHYNQATLFWNSQSDVEKAHIANAFRFELTKVQTVAIRKRMVAGLRNVSEDLAERVAGGPRDRDARAATEGARPFATSGGDARRSHCRCSRVPATAASRLVALRFSSQTAWTERCCAVFTRRLPIAARCRASSARGSDRWTAAAAIPSTSKSRSMRARRRSTTRWCYPDGKGAVKELSQLGHAMEFLKDQYRHCKPILALGASSQMLEAAGNLATLPEGGRDPGVLVFEEGNVKKAVAAFVDAIAKHRHFERETDPPRV